MSYLRALFRKLVAGIRFCWFLFHYGIGQARRLASFVRQRWSGADPLADSRDEAVYVHFDRKGVVHDYVVKQLEALVEAGFRITFVTNSPRFEEDNVALISPYCRQILWRRNVGYDFGAYKDGIAALGDLAAINRLLLMNDSVYGPVRPLSEVLLNADPERTDVWGITDSWEHHYHIQSYFIVFLKGALSSKAFRRFWRRMPYVNNKAWVIHYSEVRLTQALTQYKLRASVLSPYYDLARAALAALAQRPEGLSKVHAKFLDEMTDAIISGNPMNPSHVFWETLLVQFGSPFLKREAITSNPIKIPFVWRWDEAIARISDYDPGLIRRHLQSL